MKKNKNKVIAQQITVPDSPRLQAYQPIDNLQIESKIDLEGVRKKVFLDRYALKDKEGNLLEKNPEQMWKRVAWGVAQSEVKKVRQEWEEKFYQAMEGFKFVPAGRILSGAGTGFEVTYFNCFVIPSPKDSRQGILDALKQLVEIQSRSGGVGLNLSSLRPRGARVKKVNGFSSGPVTWAGLFSYATHDVVQQGGCFSPDTQIMTHLGLVPIKTIIDQNREWFVATHEGYKKVTAKFNNGRKNLFAVKTKAGYEVKITAEHKILTVDQMGRFYLKELKDFKVGENVVMLLGEWRDDIPYQSLDTLIPKPSKFSYGRLQVKLPNELDEYLAYLIGVYDADGSKIQDDYSSNGKGIRIAVAQDRPKDLKYLLSTIRSVFGIDAEVRNGDGAVHNVSVYSRQINEFLALNGLLKEYSINVKVPDQIFSSPRSVVEAYIAGVFTGDGGNRGGKGGFRISTVSKEFASQLQILLINLGIPSKLNFENRVAKGWMNLYTI